MAIGWSYWLGSVLGKWGYDDDDVQFSSFCLIFSHGKEHNYQGQSDLVFGIKQLKRILYGERIVCVTIFPLSYHLSSHLRGFMSISREWMLLCKELIMAEDSPHVTFLTQSWSLCWCQCIVTAQSQDAY